MVKWDTTKNNCKSKLHPKYPTLLSDNTVTVLKDKVRSAGTREWYSLRKEGLVSAIIIHDSAVTVAMLFKRLLREKRTICFDSQASNGSVCPISFIPVCDMDMNNSFVHDSVVFSREDIVRYVKLSVDFLNPITRNLMHSHDIERLGNEEVCIAYKNRVRLRRIKVESIRQYAFLETELNDILIDLIRQYFHRDTDYFYLSLTAFHETWARMKQIDKTRTVCLLKSLKQSADRFRGKPREWANNLLVQYISFSTFKTSS